MGESEYGDEYARRNEDDQYSRRNSSQFGGRDNDQHSRANEDADYSSSGSGSSGDFDYYSSQVSSRYGDSDSSPRRRRRRRRRSSSRDRFDYDQSKPHHSKGKDFAATLLGAVVGGRIGNKVSDGGFWCTAAGVFMGAWAGHDLEKMWEFHHHQEKYGKKSRRQSH